MRAESFVGEDRGGDTMAIKAAPHERRGEDELGGKRIGSTAIDGKSSGTEQVLKWPAAGQVEADAAGGLAYAGADFEELGTQGFDGPSAKAGVTADEEVDQVVSGGVQEQAEGVGQKAVTAQAVGAEAVLELLDAVLALAAIVVESEDLGGRSGAVARKRKLVPAAECSAL